LEIQLRQNFVVLFKFLIADLWRLICRRLAWHGVSTIS